MMKKKDFIIIIIECEYSKNINPTFSFHFEIYQYINETTQENYLDFFFSPSN